MLHSVIPLMRFSSVHVRGSTLQRFAGQNRFLFIRRFRAFDLIAQDFKEFVEEGHAST